LERCPHPGKGKVYVDYKFAGRRRGTGGRSPLTKNKGICWNLFLKKNLLPILLKEETKKAHFFFIIDQEKGGGRSTQEGAD